MADIHAVSARVNAARELVARSSRTVTQRRARESVFLPFRACLPEGPKRFLFLAVGTKHIRLATTDGSGSEIAQRIREAWGVEESKLGREGAQFFTVPLPSELTQFVMEFDAGKLSKFEGKIEEAEKVRFDSLARRLWNVTIDRLRRVRPLTQREHA